VDERGLAVPPRGDEEDLLPVAQIGHETVELRFAVHERVARDHLTIHEGVVHVVTLIGVMITPVGAIRLRYLA